MNDIAQAVANLDAWLETMRVPGGYGGPVVHWWQNCLSYTGAGYDWRYEGIIGGYLTLWKRTGQHSWLDKATRAADDLVAGQISGGNFQNSCFELNPYSGGTPHEAAVDLALLDLALTLETEKDGRWELFAQAAERNLRCYYLSSLWDEGAQSFRDLPDEPSLVPNKVCTLVEALFACSKLRANDEFIKRFALPALRSVLALQVKENGPLQGAIAQNHIGGAVVEAYYPYYIARCIPAFLLAYEHTAGTQWMEGALQAGKFILSHVDENSRFPQVLYGNGINRFPQWIAPLGDVLRALVLLKPYGLNFEKKALECSLLEGQLLSGGCSTAIGFASQISQKESNGLPDFRDHIPVVGWNDKAFTYLASRLPDGQVLPPARLSGVALECRIREQPAAWYETAAEMKLVARDRTLYHWRKGEPWADIVSPEVMWK